MRFIGALLVLLCAGLAKLNSAAATASSLFVTSDGQGGGEAMTEDERKWESYNYMEKMAKKGFQTKHRMLSPVIRAIPTHCGLT